MNTHLIRVTLLALLAATGSSCASSTSTDSAGDGPGKPADLRTSHAIYDIPRLSGIVIDGKGDDWGDNGFHVNALVGTGHRAKPIDDLDVSFRLAWDERGLLVLARVHDDVPVEAESESELWAADGVEMFLRNMVDGDRRDLVQVIVAPGLDPKHPKPRTHIYDYRAPYLPKVGTLTADTAVVASSKTDYLLDLIPWSNLGIKPEVGTEAAFQLIVNDADMPGSRYRAAWFGGADTAGEKGQMQRIRLADKPSPASEISFMGRMTGHGLLADVVATPALAGKTVTLVNGKATVACGQLRADGGAVRAVLTAPAPEEGKAYRLLEVLVDGRKVDVLEVGDFDQERPRRMMGLDISFHPSVFGDKNFPECDFEDAVEATNLLGPYRIETVFYDRDYQRVGSANKPGRYAAVVTITTERGLVLTRYCTLYHMAEEFPWWDYRETPGSTIALDKSFGIDPAVATAASGRLALVGSRSVLLSAYHGTDAAVDLAAISEMTPQDLPLTALNDPEARDRAWWLGFKRHINGNERRFAGKFVAPVPATQPAPVLLEGTAKDAGMVDDAAARIDAVLTQWAGDSDQAFIACIARHGVIVLHKAYGTREGKPMTTTQPSRMASLTKLMHGTCIMMAVDQGLLDLDAPIDTYLPELAGVKVATPITLRRLETHTAGFDGDHWGDEVADWELRLRDAYPRLQVLQRYNYSGMDLALASKALEQVTGQTLPVFYKTHLLDPLGCADTEVANSSYNARSTALDMAKTGQMLLNRGAYGDKRFLTESTFQKMLPFKLGLASQPNMQWGCGCCWMNGGVLGDHTFGHGAASAATLMIDPDNDLVVSMTRNAAGANFAKYHDKFLRAVFNSIAGPTSRPSNPAPDPSTMPAGK